MFKSFPKQEEFEKAALSLKYKFLMYGGGAGGGKTMVCLHILQFLALAYPKCRIYVIRKTLPVLKETTIPTFRKIAINSLYRKQGNGDILVTDSGKQKAVMKNGSEITFAAENYNSDKELLAFGGLECNFMFLEQIEELSKKMYDRAFERTGRWALENGTPPPMIFATTNPTNTWSREVIYERWKDGTLPKDFFYMPALIKDNPYLSQNLGYMSSLKFMDKKHYNKMVEGDWDVFGADSPFAYMFSDENIKYVDYDPSLPLTFCFDFGVSPMPCTILQVNKRKMSINILTETTDKNSNVYQVCDDIKAYCATFDKKPMMNMIGDPSGASRSPLTLGTSNAFQIIKKLLNFNSNQVKAPVKFSIENSRLLINSFLQHFTLTISPKCKNTIKDFQLVETIEDSQGRMKLKKTGKNGDVNHERLTHYLDSVRYAMHYNFHDFFKRIKGK